MSFIQLTDSSGDKMFVNTLNVREFKSRPNDGCYMTYTNGGSYYVKESMDEINSLLDVKILIPRLFGEER